MAVAVALVVVVVVCEGWIQIEEAATYVDSELVLVGRITLGRVVDSVLVKDTVGVMVEEEVGSTDEDEADTGTIAEGFELLLGVTLDDVRLDWLVPDPVGEYTDPLDAGV